jgi:hypothetical protein
MAEAIQRYHNQREIVTLAKHISRQSVKQELLCTNCRRTKASARFGRKPKLTLQSNAGSQGEKGGRGSLDRHWSVLQRLALHNIQTLRRRRP